MTIKQCCETVFEEIDNIIKEDVDVEGMKQEKIVIIKLNVHYAVAILSKRKANTVSIMLVKNAIINSLKRPRCLVPMRFVQNVVLG